ncbi:group II intron reverse transcriptase/maturase (plasmid) [Alkalihalobacillus hwajinpoensis]|uniref:group II intron reverse transcriptase/maturase n=1 Tax=Guptibacillus hwajinpoensis TaxID=208199 RepID=UPI001883291C|nr:group II intron reverse transcriptase/maturase [Pseudalkalibacillus hwajinpoensis]MBF0706639.1 group II intron reverse transcriptase/maturase [Pseudalkalibacillus hwajinpoensis]
MSTVAKRQKQYYDFSGIQNNLFQRSREGTQNFKNLMELIISDENILLSYRQVKSNTGAKTPGTDDQIIWDLAKKEQEAFIIYMKKLVLNYVPKSVRRVWIPKNYGKGKRPLGIPCLQDRIVQQMFLNVLQPVCEGKFYSHSYGFRPSRTTRHAVARVQTLVNINKYHYTVDIDIKGFFDNVNHSILLKQIWNIGIRDKRVIAVIGKMLKAPIKGEGIPSKGVPQGGILSPLLSNVVLNDLDHWVSDQWETFQTKHQYSANYSKYVNLRRNSKLKEGFIVRYADDFRIMTNNHDSAIKWFHAVTDFLNNRLKLAISPEKSRVINLRKKSSTFLGYKFKTAIKKNKRVFFSHIDDEKKKQIVRKIKERIYDIQRQPTASKVNLYNSVVLGVQNNFKYATHIVKDMGDIEYRVLRTLKNRLRNISKYGIPKNLPQKGAYLKFYRNTRKTYRIAKVYLFPIGQVQTTNNFNYSQSLNPYKDEKNFDWDKEVAELMKSRLTNRSVEYMDNRLSKYSAQKGKCHITGIPLKASDVHCHHKVPVGLGGTDEFNNLVIVHKDIHVAVHAIKEETIFKYVNRFSLHTKQIYKLNQLRKLCKLERITIR